MVDHRRGRGASPGFGVVIAIFAVLPARPAFAEQPDAVSLDRYRAQVAAAQQVAAACIASTSGCDSSTLPGDERVNRPGSAGAAFNVSWQWLRDTIEDARKDTPAHREAKLRTAETHLAELAFQAGGASPVADPALVSRAHTAAAVILARDEFRAADGPTWFDRQMARIQDWILRIFTGMDRLGRQAPWLAPLIEWGSFLLAAGGLVFFVRRSLARQALRIALGENAAAAVRDGRDAADWARLAQERAAAADWREALHCLYWAAIVSLEARRAWRPNPTRTPREYMRLLRPGSDEHRALLDLTRTFERVWYGQAEATESSVRAAEASLRVIETADLRRSVTQATIPATTLSAGAA